jgi:tetratricopeptide (TPR) repeat protein
MSVDLLATKQKKVNSRIFLVLLTVLFYSPLAPADTLKLKSGKTVHGKIVERTSTALQMDVGLDFPITYYLDEIKEISPDAAVTPTSSQKPSVAAPVVDAQEGQADKMEQEGLTLIDEGQMDQGLERLRQAIRLDARANRHLNLGSILLGNGVSLQKQGKSDEALKIFKEAETELQQAIKDFNPDEETTFISEAYNLLGEMYANALQDKDKAKAFYKKSLSFYENPAAERALKNLP